MKDDRAKLRRAKLIERVRRIDKQRAAADAFAAEAERARLAGISERTLLLGQAYAGREAIGDGAELRGVVALSAQLHALGVTAARQADHARQRGRCQARRPRLGRSPPQARRRGATGPRPATRRARDAA